jgi:PelA/Pel-15E family pectate lyase
VRGDGRSKAIAAQCMRAADAGAEGKGKWSVRSDEGRRAEKWRILASGGMERCGDGMPYGRFYALILVILIAVTGVGTAAEAEKLAAIDVSGFRDATHHWRAIKEPERVMQMLPDQPSYRPEQVREIAANVLLFQRENGGWPKDYDMLAILTEEQKQAVRDSRTRSDTTFDNHTTHTQVEYLARAFVATGDVTMREACVRGFDFMLAAQYENGGIPQRAPKGKGIGARITLNDGVMVGVLGVFKSAADGAPEFAWLDAARRERAREAVNKGVTCLLKCQISLGEALTGWCQQHDEKTFAAVGARTFELASICPGDTTEAVYFLMRFEQPSAEIVRAMDAAVAWLRVAQLNGIRLEKIKAPPVEFYRHNTDSDVVVVNDPKAPPLWARSYEIGTNRPIFASRDGIKVYSFAEMDRERRTGTAWFVTSPRKLLTSDYAAWRAKVAVK